MSVLLDHTVCGTSSHFLPLNQAMPLCQATVSLREHVEVLRCIRTALPPALVPFPVLALSVPHPVLQKSRHQWLPGSSPNPIQLDRVPSLGVDGSQQLQSTPSHSSFLTDLPVHIPKALWAAKCQEAEMAAWATVPAVHKCTHCTAERCQVQCGLPLNPAMCTRTATLQSA